MSYIKAQYPKLVKCITTTPRRNQFSNSVTKARLYTAIKFDVSNETITIYNNLERFRQYPMLLFNNV